MNKGTALALIITIITLLFAGRASAQNVVSHITVEKGEKWWGLHGSVPLTASPGLTTEIEKAIAPVLISSLGRYIWAEGMDVTFDGRQFTITSTQPVEAVKAGRNLREAYLVCRHKHCPPEGAALPDARFIDRPFYDTEFELGYEQRAETLLAYVERLAAQGYPKGVIMLCEGWSTEDGSYGFDPAAYPDPKALIERIHALGFSLMLTVTPHVTASGRAYVRMAGQGMLFGKHGKTTLITDNKGHRAFLDARQPQVVQAVRTGMDRLMAEYGVDGFLLDCEFAVPDLGGEERHQFVEGWMSLGRGIPLCIYSDWASLQPHSGMVFQSAGLDCFIGNGLMGWNYCLLKWQQSMPQIDAKSVTRILQEGVMLPVCTVPLAPWRCPGIKDALLFRLRINPYIAELANESLRTAEPIVRCMEYNFPCSGFADCIDQYMIGNRYLIAPMLAESDVRTVRLPKGTWADARGKRHRGPVVLEVKAASGPAWFELVK